MPQQDMKPTLGCPLHESCHCQACCSACGPHSFVIVEVNVLDVDLDVPLIDRTVRALEKGEGK
jgi:hypothetical protein